MKTKRLNKGEIYWRIFMGVVFRIKEYTEDGHDYDEYCFNSGNYFTSKAEAELVARRLNMVLKEGARAIKIPTNEEVQQAAYDNDSGYEYSQLAGSKDGIEWFKKFTL